MPSLMPLTGSCVRSSSGRGRGGGRKPRRQPASQWRWSGPSGSGKTSLLNAGLFAGLRDGGLPDLPGSAGWPCVRLTPAASPLCRLADHLGAPDAVDMLRESPSHAADLVDVFLADRPGQQLIILVDQQ